MILCHAGKNTCIVFRTPYNRDRIMFCSFGLSLTDSGCCWKEVKSVSGLTIFLLFAGGIATLFILCGILYQYFPVVDTYRVVSDRLVSDQRLVLLTDLHGCRHGKKNRKLIRMVEEAEPDYICIAGDMTLKNGLYTKDVLDLMYKLTERFPVYYAPGNHEIRMPDYEHFQKLLKNTGVIYLTNDYVPIGGNVVIYGLDLPEYWYHKVWQKREMKTETLTELLGDCRRDCFSILLAHNPEYFVQYAGWGADLTLSGHVHGGIARLPRLGGVIDPSLKLFPAYDAGEFEEKGHRMILSRGLGLHHIKLRFFNRPEVSVINLSCQETEE